MAKKESKLEEEKVNFVSLVPAPSGMLAHYRGMNAQEQPVTGARQVVALALDAEGKIHFLTTADVTAAGFGKLLDGNEELSFSHVTL